MSKLQAAKEFFDACETGKGWDACRSYCHASATFSAQAHALDEVTSLEAYCDWMKAIATTMPDASYELKFFGADESGDSVAAVAIFKGTHTADGGPVPPTGKSVASDYAYHMVFDGEQISHMTKVWNDGVALEQAGWV
ncbi:MAG: ester cyclase [Pseudomonadota bacterium]